MLRLQIGQCGLRGFQFLDARGEVAEFDMVGLFLRRESLLMLCQFGLQLGLGLRALGEFLFEFGAAGEQLGCLLFGRSALVRFGGQGYVQRFDLFDNGSVLRLQIGECGLRGFQFPGARGEVAEFNIVDLNLRLVALLLGRQFGLQLCLGLRALGEFLLEFDAAGEELGRLLFGGGALAGFGGQGRVQRFDLFGNGRM